MSYIYRQDDAPRPRRRQPDSIPVPATTTPPVPAAAPILSDGKPCSVRMLGVFQLDAAPFNDPGELEYDYAISDSQIIKKRSHLWDFNPPPQQPTTPREACQPATVEAVAWKQFDLYQLTLQRRLERIGAAEKWALDVQGYVKANCLAEVDQPRVKTPEDLNLILIPALLEEKTIPDYERVFTSTFGLPGGAVAGVVFGALALREYRIHSVIMRHAKMSQSLYLPSKVELLLTCYRVHQERERAAMAPIEWLRTTIEETRAEQKKIVALASETEDPATAAAALDRLKVLTDYMGTLRQKLAEIAPEEQEAPERAEEGVTDGGL